MTRLPVWPTVLVAAAVATMIGLGIWQLERAQWKESLLADYAAAAGKPPIAWPIQPDAEALPLYRRSSVDCARVLDWRATSGRNADGGSGWIHIARCGLASGGEAQVVAGWSERPDNPGWAGGRVTGTIAPDSQHGLRLVAQPPVARLAANRPPSLDDIPNNHLAYAGQWFLFAAMAALIYFLALRRRAAA